MVQGWHNVHSKRSRSHQHNAQLFFNLRSGTIRRFSSASVGHPHPAASDESRFGWRLLNEFLCRKLDMCHVHNGEKSFISLINHLRCFIFEPLNYSELAGTGPRGPSSAMYFDSRSKVVIWGRGLDSSPSLGWPPPRISRERRHGEAFITKTK